MPHLERKLTLHYAAVLLFIALLFGSAYLLVRSLLSEQQYDGRIINVAGMQRTLSQKITKEALAMYTAATAEEWKIRRSKLEEANELLWRTHQNLIGEAHDMGFTPLSSPEVTAIAEELEPSLINIRRTATELLSRGYPGQKSYEGDSPIRLIRTLLESESAFLPQMDKLVLVYEEESIEHAHRLGFLQLAIMLVGIATSIVAALFIFRPMVNQIVFEQSVIKDVNAGLRESEQVLREKTEELESTQKVLIAKEQELKMSVDILKEKEAELSEQNDELLASEEELRQQQQALKMQQEITSLGNQRLEANQAMLMKLIDQLKAKEAELTNKNEYIELSIRNAQHIQNSILPNKEARKKLLPDHCLLFLPKSTVSGDFFWISKHGDRTLVGVIDCTGHGISGAFISLLGYSLLRQIVFEEKCIEPALILSKLNEGIASYFRQDENQSNYGMDAGFCLITPNPRSNQTQLIFAGAKNRLYLIKNSQLDSVRGTAASLGGYYSNKDISFENNTCLLTSGDTVYLATDGFLDQANPSRKRFGRKAFMDLLYEVYREPMYTQSYKLSQQLEEFRQKEPQRDDITVLGFRV